MENNQAFIAKIGNIKPIENADRIVQADVILKGVPQTKVVVAKDAYKENDFIVYFDSNLCLTQEFIDYFNNKNGGSIDTYLAKGNRVRTVKLRGVISDGLVVGLNQLSSFFKNKTVTEGFSFDTLGGMRICYKYVPQEKLGNTSATKGKKLKSRILPDTFQFHVETEQLLRNVEKLNPKMVASITRKIHGTSAICSRMKVQKKLTLLEKLAKSLGVTVVETEYDYLFASRTVVKNAANPKGPENDLWVEVGKRFVGRLKKGETIYYEIVGYGLGGGMIQKPFDYGCYPGEHKVAIYRITLTSEDGTIAEYSWQAVKERAAELETPTVEEFFYGRLGDLYPEIEQDTNWNSKFVAKLEEDFLEKDCPLSRNKVPDEGIVLRPESLRIEPFKLKSKRFILKESELKEKDGFVDPES